MNQKEQSCDDVVSFLRRVHDTHRRTGADLKQLSLRRADVAERIARLRARGSDDVADLFDELVARDDELAAVSDELHEQVESLQLACALLERERSKYLDLFVNAPDAYVVTDLDGVTQDANARAAAVFCVEPRSLSGRPLIAFVARQDTRAFRSLVNEIEKDDPHVDVRSATLRMGRRGQAPFAVALRAVRVRCASARALAIRWSLRPLDLAEVSGRVKDGLDTELTRMLQDLREPLATIQSWVGLLREGKVDGESERQHALAWIEKTAADEQVLLDELRELAELQAHRPDLVAAPPIDLGEEIRAVCAAVAPQVAVAANKAAHLEVKARPELLRRALVLLVRRAMAGLPHVPSALPRIELGRDADDAVVSLRVPDGTPAPPSWGIRMCIATKIVEAHGGRLVLTDDCPSAELRLPLVRAPSGPRLLDLRTGRA